MAKKQPQEKQGPQLLYWGKGLAKSPTSEFEIKAAFYRKLQGILNSVERDQVRNAFETACREVF